MSAGILGGPVKITATIKRTSSNHETGERLVVLSLPQTEAANVAQLSIYDGIEFEVTFNPTGA